MATLLLTFRETSIVFFIMATPTAFVICKLLFLICVYVSTYLAFLGLNWDTWELLGATCKILSGACGILIP